ncbi:MAG: hypothetical protein B7Y75_04170 [Azorhizobium sp. 35-67-5]|nr:MAG: hypothetical protein B7Y75_04170 [Azorhizobium sp. 35-67-5]
MDVEGHGRHEDIAAEVDLSRTVGWFTAKYPVALAVAGLLFTLVPAAHRVAVESANRQVDLAPELAESWKEATDGMSCTFNLRKDATFHDGTPVTAKDVKWSFDRAVSVGGFPTFQMSAGSLEKKEQFVVVDDHTFRIDYLRKDKMLLFNVAVVVPFIINSTLAQKNATPDDPWAMAWLKANEAGGGAYKLDSWKPGTETVLSRFDSWKNGKMPSIRRIIIRDVPSAGTRRAMLERGDADLSSGLPPKDFDQLIKENKVKVVGVPIPNCLWYVALNRFSGWLDYSEYYFYWNFHGNNSIFNISAYKNPEMDKLIDKARFSSDPAEYDATVKQFIALAMKDLPIVPLNQPIHDVAMQKSVSGYEFWFHREPDYRQFTKG